MRTYRLAIVGFGNVGQGLAQILRDRGAHLADRFGARFQILAVSDLLKGSVYDPAGLNPGELLASVQADGHLDRIAALHRGWDAQRVITECDADAVVELSYTNLQTGEPAFSHMRLALEHGRHVVTSNKGPIALHYAELSVLAHEKGCEIGAEGTVMSGTPTLRVGQELLSAAGIQRIQGILNGTTNYILTQMESGATYADALADAQARGYAEADPTGDVEGYDAAGKVVILANLVMGVPLRMNDVERQGITHLSPQDIDGARARGERWKLIGSLEKVEDPALNPPVHARVHPVPLPISHPLAGVSGATNAITFTTELLGEVTLVGPGAGRLETGYALIGDLLAIHRKVATASSGNR